MAKHNISYASDLFYGSGGSWPPGVGHFERQGQKITPPVRWNFDNIAPAAADNDAIARSQSLTGSGTITLDGSYVSGGIATLDVPRNVVITRATGSGTSKLTFIAAGKDYYGESLTEKIIGPGGTASAGTGLKAFATVSSITCPTVTTLTGDTIRVGFGTALGVPFAYTGKRDVLAFYTDDTDDIASSTFTGADTATATASTGDVRGTVSPNTAPNGSRKYTLWFAAIGVDTRNDLYGVAQA